VDGSIHHAIAVVWPHVPVQLRVVHLPRLAALRLEEGLGPTTMDLRTIYTVVDHTSAEPRSMSSRSGGSSGIRRPCRQR
jgi:hypothetical protein